MPPIGAHKTRTTPYHLASDGLVECFNRTLLMMLVMFARKHCDDWNDLLPAVVMAYHSSVHKSTGFSPYRLMFGEECTLSMDVGLPRPDLTGSDSNLYALWVRVLWRWLTTRYQAVRRQKRLYDKRAVKRVFSVGEWTMQTNASWTRPG